MSDWLDALPCRIGQIFVASEAEGRIALMHRDDVGRADLTNYDAAEAAIELARFDDAGGYRPLKTAPNLRHGWRVVLRDRDAARRALDFFYPGRAPAYRMWKAGQLRATPLRETLARQTGMYRVTARIGDEQAEEVVANVCRSDGGCLRTIFWQRDATGASASKLLPASKLDPAVDQTGGNETTLPLICQEACNLLVAEIRQALKA